MDKIELKILGISSGQSTASYTLILEQKNGNKKLPVVIGAFEAQAIAIQIEKITPPRPMTHDLFKSMAGEFNILVKEVIIHKLHEGVFYANIICEDETGKEREIDARTSDAIAIALRFNSPIFTYRSIMDDAGIILSEEGPEEDFGSEEPEPAEPVKQKPIGESDLEDMELEELKEKLEKAIEIENYILAAKIRDEIQKRENKG